MPRKRNPERIARENQITRGIACTKVEYSVVPRGGNAIETHSESIYGNTQYAIREAKAHAREIGTLISDVRIIETSAKLYTMKIEDYIAGATVLDENYNHYTRKGK